MRNISVMSSLDKATTKKKQQSGNKVGKRKISRYDEEIIGVIGKVKRRKTDEKGE